MIKNHPYKTWTTFLLLFLVVVFFAVAVYRQRVTEAAREAEEETRQYLADLEAQGYVAADAPTLSPQERRAIAISRQIAIAEQWVDDSPRSIARYKFEIVGDRIWVTVSQDADAQGRIRPLANGQGPFRVSISTTDWNDVRLHPTA